MKILSFAYEDKTRQWQLEPVVFGPLTLLVGASGVGKTQILRSITSLVRVAAGDSLNGIEWRMTFRTTPNAKYIWEGAFESLPENHADNGQEQTLPKIQYEKLHQNDTLLVERSETNVYFRGDKTVRLPQEKSLIGLLEEEPVRDVYQQLQKISLVDYSNIRWGSDVYSMPVGIAEQTPFRTLKKIRGSGLRLKVKLYLCFKHVPDTFKQIKQTFMAVFPFVEDIRIKPWLLKDGDNILLRAWPIIQIKEKDVAGWIDERHISSGMYRTLLQISDLYLCANGSVFLIDEFENSLGVNCLDELMDVMLTYERRLQFIITSHHPYIINNIGYKHWKIVTRKGGVVTARPALDFNLGRSKHEAFTQLINLDAYLEGIAA
jgi:AAA15 family ATPase/GTPase